MSANPATLFGFKVSDERVFFGPKSGLTEYLLEDDLSDLSTPQGNVSNTFSCGSAFYSQTFPIVSVPVVGSSSGRVWAERIEERLLEAEAKAQTPVQREEYQLARRTLRRAFYDNCTNAYYLAFCWMYGGSPEVIARKQANYRSFMLSGTATYALPPKKPVAAVKSGPESIKKASL